jgi:nucleoside 2-deoxyribosyltransferase
VTSTERKRAHTPHQPVGRWIRADKRLAIYLRDDLRCGGCGRDLRGAPAREVTLDHIRPRCRGGTNHATNLYTCCLSCNSARGSLSLGRAYPPPDRAPDPLRCSPVAAPPPRARALGDAVGGSMIVYLAHPVSAPDAAGVAANIQRSLRWLSWLVHHTQHAISAPWLAYVQALLEETHRARGLTDDLAMLERCDAIVLVGDRVSAGMALESGHARHHRIPVIDLTYDVGEPPAPGTALDQLVRERLAVLDAPRSPMVVAPRTAQAEARRRKANRR